MSEDYAERGQPEPVTIPAPEQQVTIGLVDTPVGQRLAVQLTVLLDAAAARQIAEHFAKAAAAMSATGLVVANGALAK